MATDSADSYPPEARSKVQRKGQRGAYDFATVHGIFEAAPIMHVSFAPSPTDPFPTTLPMIGALGTFPEAAPLTSRQSIYLHGHVATRLARLSTAAHTLDEDEGLPVCVAATCIDGLVLALTPFNHSMNYRSAVAHGWAVPVTDAAEKDYAMKLVTDKVMTHRWENSRTPPTSAEITGTSIMRVNIVSASAKTRVGGASDDKKDSDDKSLRERVWTGVVPMYVTMGEPVAAPENQVAVPAYLKEFRDNFNAQQEGYAKGAIDKEG